MTVPSLLLAAAFALQQPAHDSILLRVLATNDFHAAFDARVLASSNGRPLGGAAALAGMMNRLQAECACPTVRLDGGDVMQGTPASNLLSGRSAVDVFNAMHYSAAAIGNHEFDFGLDTLIRRVAQANFSWLSANIRERATGHSPAWVKPQVTVTAGSLKVAVVGYTTITTPTSTKPWIVAELRFPGAAALDSAIAAARSSHPDFVIVVAHEGAFCNRDSGCSGEIVDVARALTHKPDLIVSGHTHSLVNTVVNGIPIVQARSSGTALGVVDFVASAGGREARVRVEDVWADREQPDTAVQRVVTAAEDQVRPLTSRPVVTLAQDLPRDDSSGALYDMVADALREAAHADVGLANKTGIRADLRAGAITWGDCYQVLPFANFVVKVTVSGAVLKQAIEHALGAREAIAVSGVTGTYDLSAPADHRLRELVLADGRPVADDASYTLGTFDFLAGGGSGFFMLRGRPSENTGIDELDAFIALLQRQPQPVRVATPHSPRLRRSAS